MLLQDIPGLPETKQKLLQSAQRGNIAHAQLFHGSPGSSQLPLALAYAQYLSCENPGETDSCGQCKTCKQFSHFNYPDIHYLFPVATTKRVSSKPTCAAFQGEWQELLSRRLHFSLNDWLAHLGAENKQAMIRTEDSLRLVEQLNLKSFGAGYHFVILWLPELLHGHAANKLLKSLEEPGNKTVFILISDRVESVLQTITSRCQKVHIPRQSKEALKQHLLQQGHEEPTAAQAALLANGSLLEAERLTNQSERYLEYAELFKDWMRACYSLQVGKILPTVEAFSQWERDRQKEALRFFMQTFQQLLTGGVQQEIPQHPLFQRVYFDLSRFAPFVRPDNTGAIYEVLEEALSDLSRNGNAKIIMLDASLRISRFLRKKAA